jgi:hypothetical protein
MRGTTSRALLPTYPAPVRAAPPPPILRSDRTRADLVRRIREFADEWQDTRHTAAGDPALAAEREELAERLHAFATQLVRRREHIETLPKPEMIVLVLSAVRVPADDFTSAIAEYARDVVYVEADDLKIPQGLMRAFRR